MKGFTSLPSIPHLGLPAFGLVDSRPTLHMQHSCCLRSLPCVALAGWIRHPQRPYDVAVVLISAKAGVETSGGGPFAQDDG
jgi:hypothetical protein